MLVTNNPLLLWPGVGVKYWGVLSTDSDFRDFSPAFVNSPTLYLTQSSNIKKNVIKALFSNKGSKFREFNYFLGFSRIFSFASLLYAVSPTPSSFTGDCNDSLGRLIVQDAYVYLLPLE